MTLAARPIPRPVIHAKWVAARLPRELGFVNRAALIESHARGELLTVGKRAFCHFHMRRDEQVTIYELGVARKWQGRGLGKRLVERVAEKARRCGKTFIQLRCPVDQAANGFYRRMGFRIVRVERGRKRRINVWRLPL